MGHCVLLCLCRRRQGTVLSLSGCQTTSKDTMQTCWATGSGVISFLSATADLDSAENKRWTQHRRICSNIKLTRWTCSLKTTISCTRNVCVVLLNHLVNGSKLVITPNFRRSFPVFLSITPFSCWAVNLPISSWLRIRGVFLISVW